MIRKAIPALVCAVTLLWAGQVTAQESGVAAMFKGKLTDSQGNEVKAEQLKGKVVGVYFSAHWCPPCRTFTPKLVKFRDANKEKFEIVFVSADKSAAAQKKYMTETKMQWPAVEYKGADSKALTQKFKVNGIPKLVILSADGKIITEDGRGDVHSNPSGALKKWESGK